MSNLPQVSHPTDRPNFSLVTVGDLEIGFSYSTPVAFRKGYGPWVVSENLWGPTTGRHLSWFPGGADKSRRYSREAFEIALEAACAGDDTTPGVSLVDFPYVVTQ